MEIKQRCSDPGHSSGSWILRSCMWFWGKEFGGATLVAWGVCCFSNCSVIQSWRTPCDPMDCSRLGNPVLHHLQSLLKLMSIESVMPSNHLILYRLLLLLPSIFPSIRVVSNESVLHIRWPKYCSFSFSIIPSNEYSGLISFRIDWFDLLGTLQSICGYE